MKKRRIAIFAFLCGLCIDLFAQNIIENAGFENGNQGFETDYVWVNGHYVVESGHYRIDNTTSGYGGGAGWPEPGNSNGNFMIVNGFGGSTNPTKTVWRETVSVTSNTTYTFSYRYVNLNRVLYGQINPAKLQMKINGSNFGSVNQLPSDNNWHTWESTWNSGSATVAVIEILDMYTGLEGLGDDFCLDDFSLLPNVVYSVDAQDDYVDVPLCLNDIIDVDVLGNDNVLPNTNDAQVQILTNPIPHGTAEVLSNKKIRYIFNDSNYFGEVQLDYRVTLHGLQSDASVHLTVNAVPLVESVSMPAGVCEGDALVLDTPQITWRHNDPSTCWGSWEIQINGVWDSLINENIPYEYNGCVLRYKAVNGCGISYSTNNVPITVYSTEPIDEGTIAACDVIYHHGQLCDETGPYTFDSITPNGCHIQVSWSFVLGDVNIMAPEVCESCYSYYWPRTGQTYYESTVVHDTVYSNDPQVCDSIFTLDLTINNAPAIQGNIQIQDICAGELLEATEPEYAYNHSGGGLHQWEFASTPDGTFQAFDPETYHFEYGSYYIRFAVANGCDTVFSNVVLVHVNDQPVISGQLEPLQVCEGNPLDLPEVTVDWRNASQEGVAEWQIAENQAGPYSAFEPYSQIQLGQDGYWVRYMAGNECDMVYLGPVRITVIAEQEEWVSHTGCDTVWYEGTAYTEDRIIDVELYDPCPHTIHHHVLVTYSDLPENDPTLIDEFTSCHDEFEWHGTTYYRSDGPQTDRWITENISGCDSVRELRLDFGEYAAKTHYVVECDSFTWIRNGMTYYYDESHQHVLDSMFIQGDEVVCDSVVYLNLLLGGSTLYEFDTVACEPFTWYGNECIYDDMTCFHTFQTAAGCDSTVMMHVNLSRPINNVQFLSRCDSITLGGVFYDLPEGENTHSYRIVVDTLVGSNGCDSIIIINLTLHDSQGVGRISGESHVIVASSLFSGIYRYEIDTAFIEGTISWSLSNPEWRILDHDNVSCRVFVTTPGNAQLKACFNAYCGETCRDFEINAGFFGMDDQNYADAKVYPNPTEGIVTIEAEGIKSIRLTNMMGQVLDWREYDRVNTVVLNMNGYTPSVYLLEIKTFNGVVNRKVAISR